MFLVSFYLSGDSEVANPAHQLALSRMFGVFEYQTLAMHFQKYHHGKAESLWPLHAKVQTSHSCGKIGQEKPKKNRTWK